MRVVNDRRGAKRVTVRGEARLQTPQGPLRCRCVDISAGGMSVVSPQPARPRQRARIESSFGGQNLVFEAVVVRRLKSREGYVLGLRFDRLDPFTRAQLDAVLRSMQVQAALAQQGSSFVDRLPQLQLPGPDLTDKTIEAEHVERPPVDAAAPEPQAWPQPAAVDPVEWLVAHERPTPTVQWSARVPATPGAGAPAKATSRSNECAEPHWDRTVVAPGPPVARPFGLGDAWTEEELETRNYHQPNAQATERSGSSPQEPATLELEIDLELGSPPLDVPALSDDLLAALERVRRSDASTKTQPHPVVPPPAVLADLDLGDGT